MKKTLLVAISIIAIITIICAYVILSQTSQQPKSPTSNNNPKLSQTAIPSLGGQPSSYTMTEQPVGETVKFKTVTFVDSQGIGAKAFSMLIPINWQSSGEITWLLDNPAMPAYGSFKAWNPEGDEEYNYFANQAYFWSTNQMLLQTFPAGSHYFGAEVHEPLSPIEALKQIVLPNHRPDVQNLVIKSEKQLPELSNLIETGTDEATGVVTSASGGKIRIEYTLNGKTMEEEMYCVVQSLDIPVQTFTGTTRNVNWYLTYLESFRAAKGQLDSETKMFQTISHSAQTDKNWLNKYNQIVNYLIQKQIQQIQDIGQLSSIISQTSNEISDANYQAWQQNQNVNDKIATDFSNYILGVETYKNPLDGTKVDLPSGYSYAWTNSLGEYILTDSPGYNPNIDSNINWQQMTP